MLVLIIALAAAITVIFVQLYSNYYTQVRVMRRFFRKEGSAPEETLEHVSVIKDIEYDSVLRNGKLDLYTSNYADGNQPLLIWVHGGGYVGGDKSCCEAWARVIAHRLKVAVASINYCLAPEQHYPGPLIQLSEAYLFLAAHKEKYGLDVEKTFLAGDSAGAQIVSQYAALVCDSNLREKTKIRTAIPAENLLGTILCCGIYDIDTVTATKFPAIRTFMWAYTDCKKLKNFPRKDEMSAAKTLTEDYCDVFITCGNADPFLGQTHEMIAACKAHNIVCEAYLPGLPDKKSGHEYQFNVGTAPADEALDRAVTFIKKRIGGDNQSQS